MYEAEIQKLNETGKALLLAGRSRDFLALWRAADRPFASAEACWLTEASACLCLGVVRTLLAAGAPAQPRPLSVSPWKSTPVPLLGVLEPHPEVLRRLTLARRTALQVAIAERLVAHGASPDHETAPARGQVFRQRWLADRHVAFMKAWVARQGTDWVRHPTPYSWWRPDHRVNPHDHFGHAVEHATETNQPRVLALLLDWAHEESPELGRNRTWQAMGRALRHASADCLEVLLNRGAFLPPQALMGAMDHAKGRWSQSAIREAVGGVTRSDSRMLYSGEARAELRQYSSELLRVCRRLFAHGAGADMPKKEQGRWISIVVSRPDLGEGDVGRFLLQLACEAGWKPTPLWMKHCVASLATASRFDLLADMMPLLPPRGLLPGENKEASLFSLILTGLRSASKNRDERVALRDPWARALEEARVRLNRARPTLLHTLWHESPEWIGWALKQGAPVGLNREHQTALMQAIQGGDYQGSLSAEASEGLRALASAPEAWADWAGTSPLHHWTAHCCRLPLPMDCVPPDILNRPDQEGRTPLDKGIQAVLGDLGTSPHGHRPLDGFGVIGAVQRLAQLVEAGGRPSPGYGELRPRLLAQLQKAAKEATMVESLVAEWIRPFDTAALHQFGEGLEASAARPRCRM